MYKRCLVITSIQSSENQVLRDYAVCCKKHGTGFIVVGDAKSPGSFQLNDCDFLGLKEQRALPFKLATLLPDHNYAKKNIGYLQAIYQGAELIVESDDDNVPLENFWDEKQIHTTGDLVEKEGWINVYNYFSEATIWPRGFSLAEISSTAPIPRNSEKSFFSPIQQGLVDENPDVDAIYRLTRELPVYFKKRDPIVLGNGSLCPFNTQNTTWFQPAFPLLYLPSFCSFRMCDIWRSFVAQRILWTNNWHLSFHNASVCQKRNEHDLLKDFKEEVPGYLNNDEIVKGLRALKIKAGEEYLPDNLRTCYGFLVENNFLDKKELPLLEAWIQDLQAIHNIG